ncbi:PEGA domain-containing protein [Rhodanobacter sp. UC4451_H18]
MHLAVLMLVLAAGGSAQAQALQVGTLRVESTPSGAEVELIGGKAGVTPLTITERDIYPNRYPDARAERYGMITLRHAGCEPLTHRVTLDDLKQDLHLRLDCIASASTPAASRVPAPLAAPATLPPAPMPSVPQRRLRQLEVLQELLDEGLITPAEEQRVRRRILQPGTHPGH